MNSPNAANKYFISKNLEIWSLSRTCVKDLRGFLTTVAFTAVCRLEMKPAINLPYIFHKATISIKHPLPPPPPPPPPPPIHPCSSQTINVDWSVMVYSVWKFILFLVIGRMTSNFMCLTFSTLRSSHSVENCYHFLIVRKSQPRPQGAFPWLWWVRCRYFSFFPSHETPRAPQPNPQSSLTPKNT